MKAGTFLYGSIEIYTFVAMNGTQLLNLWTPACAGVTDTKYDSKGGMGLGSRLRGRDGVFAD